MKTCRLTTSVSATFGRDLGITIVIVFLLLVPCVYGFAGEPKPDLARTVTGFYTVYLKTRPSGLPQERQLKSFGRYLSTSLMNQIRAANQSERQYQKANRGDVPPLVEGDIFTSLFEGATRFRVLGCDAKPLTGVCSVEFTNVDRRDKSAVKWTDKVYVTREANRWMIDDIEYLGDWQFIHKGRLSDLLKSVIQEKH